MNPQDDNSQNLTRAYLANLQQKAAQEEPEIQALVRKLKKNKKKRRLDERVHELHDEAFTKINCLDCANCCKNISPIIYEKDIDRIARHLRIRPADFTRRYLRVDDEGDYVFRNKPCPFLMPDNYCSIYSIRPRSCRDYPHTDRKNFHQILHLAVRDIYTCPAVLYIFQQLKPRLG